MEQIHCQMDGKDIAPKSRDTSFLCFSKGEQQCYCNSLWSGGEEAFHLAG